MRRRSKAGGKPAKGRGRETATPKRRIAPKAAHRPSSAAGLSKQVATLKRERDEALAHQNATGEILASISSSMTDAKPVFEAIVRICCGCSARVSPLSFSCATA